MEIYVLYQSVSGIFGKFRFDIVRAQIISIIIAFSIWLGLFILQGIGIWKMAKNRGMSKKGLAFVPFANYLYMGKIAGVCNFFSQKVKKMGLFVMIAQIVTTLLCVALLTAKFYLCVVGNPIYDEQGNIILLSLNSFESKVEYLYVLGEAINSIPQLIYELLLLMLTMSLFKKYAPKNYMILALLGAFVPMSRYIVIFCLRNKQEIDYEAYMRARREAMAREYQQRYGGAYGTPYGGTQYNNPYANPYPQQPTPPTPAPQDPFEEFDETPFGEFDGEKKTSTDNVTDNVEKPNANDDGFFG